jgi:hypothetical protein
MCEKESSDFLSRKESCRSLLFCPAAAAAADVTVRVCLCFRISCHHRCLSFVVVIIIISMQMMREGVKCKGKRANPLLHDTRNKDTACSEHLKADGSKKATNGLLLHVHSFTQLMLQCLQSVCVFVRHAKSGVYRRLLLCCDHCLHMMMIRLKAHGTT